MHIRVRYGRIFRYGGIILLSLLGRLVYAQPLSVEVTTHMGDGAHLRDGQELILLLSVSRPAWLWLVYEDAAGELWQLLPAPRDDGRREQAIVMQPYPQGTMGQRLQLAAPYGVEHVWLFAAEDANLLPSVKSDSFPASLDYKRAQLLQRMDSAVHRGEVARAAVEFSVRPK